MNVSLEIPILGWPCDFSCQSLPWFSSQSSLLLADISYGCGQSEWSLGLITFLMIMKHKLSCHQGKVGCWGRGAEKEGGDRTKTKAPFSSQLQPHIPRQLSTWSSTPSPPSSLCHSYGPGAIAAHTRVIHTLYLSFFLHGQNIWRIKFTPENANFSR